MCTNSYFSHTPKSKFDSEKNMDNLIGYFPLFNMFLKELSYGDIVSVESISIERFQHRTFIREMSGFFNLERTATSREINSKLIINVSCVSNYWEFEKPIIISQFTSMFKRQFNFIDFDYCLVEIKDILRS